MKKLIVFGLLISLASCKSTPFVAPFVIVDMMPESNYCKGFYCQYEYADANGKTEHFCDSLGKYNIGDTIK